MFYQKFRIAPNKMLGWKRLVGQEVPIEAYSDIISVAGKSSFPADVTDLIDVDGNAAVAGPVSSAQTTRRLSQVVNGPQTPKLLQPALDIWTPLIFWFNQDPRLSIASVSIPFGQRFITLDIENQSNLVFVAPGNLFLRLTVEQQFSAGAGKGLATAVAVSDVKKFVTLTPVLASGSVVDNTQQIRHMDLYINNISG